MCWVNGIRWQGSSADFLIYEVYNNDNMNLKILIFAFFISHPLFTFAAELVDLSVEQVRSMQRTNDGLVIDIRTEKEWQDTGIIASSHPLMFFDNEGKYNTEKWLAHLTKLKSYPDQPVILVCRSGNRSSRVGRYLTQQLGMNNVYHLSGGIKAWLKSGQKLDKICSNQIACK